VVPCSRVKLRKSHVTSSPRFVTVKLELVSKPWTSRRPSAVTPMPRTVSGSVVARVSWA
jgi:hypothetical protein